MNHSYDAFVTDCHDGDTLTVVIDLGLGVKKTDHIRLIGIDAPELITQEGKVAQEFLSPIVLSRTVVLNTEADKREKYGRLLAEVIVDGKSVNQMMLTSGYAKPYDGGKRA